MPPLTQVIRAFKYGGGELLGEALAERLVAPCGELGASVDLVTAVPLPWPRLIHRGYDQAEEVARPLAARLARPYRRLLRRRLRRRQATLGRAARQQNLRDAFVARRGVPRGATILLVDDVMTTGATLAAAATSLRRAGADCVLVAVVARTPEDSWGGAQAAGCHALERPPPEDAEGLSGEAGAGRAAGR